MEFALNDDQLALQKTVREFAERSVKPVAAEIDQKHRYPAELVAQMAELGLMGMEVEVDDGGSGMDAISYVIAMEEVSAACASTGVIMSVNNSLVCHPLRKFANPEQKKKYLEPLALGEKLGCFMLSEPEAGSDAAAQRTVAEKVEGGYRITGTKNWITNGPQADIGILQCMTDKSKGHRGISTFILSLIHI